MRRPEEVQVVFKERQDKGCQDKDATEKDRHCRRAMAKGTVEGHGRRAMKKEMKKERGRTMEKGNGEEQ